MHTYPKITKVRYIQNDLKHECRKYDEIFYVLYSFQNTNDVILMEIKMSVK